MRANDTPTEDRMPPRNAAPAITDNDPDGLMAAAQAIESTPNPNPLPPPSIESTPNPNPLPPPSIESAIQPVEDRGVDDLNFYERRAMSAQAARLVENEAFKLACNELRRKYLEILLQQRIGSAEYLGAVSRCQTAMVLLDEIAGQLDVIVDAVVFDQADGPSIDERTRSRLDNAVRATVTGGR